MSCKECVYYQESYSFDTKLFHCGFYNCDFTSLVDDDLDVCSHFEEDRQ